jgi:large subunit ribosomal protein L13
MRGLSAKTPQPKKETIAEQWYVVDAKDQVLGRLATTVANLLRGKHQPTFAPHVATNNHVVIINADKFAVSGTKRETKMYRRHSTRPGSLQERNLEETLKRVPTRPVEMAIERMLPVNRLRAVWMNHLHVYIGADHPHQAQQPQVVAIDAKLKEADRG